MLKFKIFPRAMPPNPHVGAPPQTPSLGTPVLRASLGAEAPQSPHPMFVGC